MAEAAVIQVKRIHKVSKMSGRDPCLALLDLGETYYEELNTSPAQKLMSRLRRLRYFTNLGEVVKTSSS